MCGISHEKRSIGKRKTSDLCHVFSQSRKQFVLGERSSLNAADRQQNKLLARKVQKTLHRRFNYTYQSNTPQLS